MASVEERLEAIEARLSKLEARGSVKTPLPKPLPRPSLCGKGHHWRHSCWDGAGPQRWYWRRLT